MKKKCISCKQERELFDFYHHKGMKDGYLNKCITCCKKQYAIREKILKKDPVWIDKERKRGREKYKRLKLKTNNKSITHKLSTRIWKSKFPEKRLAQQASQNISCPKGFHRHHWSYKKEHQKDVIIFSVEEHNLCHRFIIYDQERFMFRDLDGILLDTKEKHLEYFNLLKGDSNDTIEG